MRFWLVFLGVFFGVASSFGLLAISPMMPISPGESVVWVGANEFLYADRFRVENVVEIGYRRGVGERLGVNLRSWRLGAVAGVSYLLLGDRNHWYRLTVSGDGGISRGINDTNWVTTTDVALGMDVSLWRSMSVYFSTGWRLFSLAEYPEWRLSAGIWMRWRSWVLLPEVSLVRFAQFDPSFPPFYFNPAVCVGFSF